MNLALNQFELPIRISQDRPVTDEELMRLSAENEPMRFERDANGEVIVMTPTGTGGGRIESRVYLVLGTGPLRMAGAKHMVPLQASSFQIARFGLRMLPG
jgi:hypothetical protein